jgi:Predicted integral membrane protein
MFSRDKSEYIPWENGCKAFFAILIVGLVIRFVFMPITSSPFDIGAGWVAIIEGTYSGDTIYESGWYFYPPVWGYILSIISGVADLIGMGSFGSVFTSIYDGQVLTIGHGLLTNLEFNFLVKIPALIFDVLAGLAAYEIVKRLTGDQKKAVIGFALWFLAPVVVMSSSILGMFDSIMMFLMMFSLLTFMDKKYFLTGTLVSIAFFTKIFAIFLIPVMVAYIISERDLSVKERYMNLLRASLGFALVGALIYLPAILTGEFTESLTFFTMRGDMYADSGGFQFSPTFNNVFFYFPFLIVVYLAIFGYMFTRKREREKTFLWMVILSIIPMFALPFVAYTPTYGITLLPAVLLLFSFKGKIAYIPWLLLFLFPLHGILHYWETLFYPLAAFTDLLDINNIVERFPNGFIYNLVNWLIFLPGMSIAIITAHYVAKKKEVYPWIKARLRLA